jgi:hypothetical protein
VLLGFACAHRFAKTVETSLRRGDVLERFCLQVLVGDPCEVQRGRRVQLPVIERITSWLAESEQLEAGVHVGLRFAHLVAELVGVMPVQLHELLVAFRLLERMQIRALQVLDELYLEDLLVVPVADERRDLVELRLLCSEKRRSPADDLELAAAVQ